MRDNYTTVYSYLKNKIDSFQRFHRWNVEIKHLSSIFFFYFFTFYLPGCTFLRDGNFLFYVKVTFTWFADNLCTSNFCSVILSGELDFGARIVEDLTLGKWESFLLARSSVCTFFENSFNGNKPWKIERFESFLISMHFPRSDFSSLKKNNFERIEFNTSVNLIWSLYCSLSRQSV